MTPFPTRTALALLLPLAITAGCGGGGGGSVLPDTDATPGIGAANEQASENSTGSSGANGNTDNGVDNSGGGNSGSSDGDSTDSSEQTQSPVATTVNGRVADGYIQGAVVCVDINENGSCDDDEPSATSGEGGAYELDIPADATDKPIIADVPETAIDEDTGQAIGKKLTLSTPADRPEFISPITTLVHEELKENPDLTVDEAEGTVKEELGLSDNQAGLFVDYVERQRNDDESADDYRFIHQAARVVATMMDDIQDQVEQAANDSGIDFISDEETRKAMRQLVRKEVRELLPEISLAVAEEIQQRTSDESGEEGESTDPRDPLLVDVERLAERLDRKEDNIGIVEKIDAIKERTEASRVAMQDLLEQGMYWLEVECDHEEIYEGDEFEPENIDPVKIILDDEGAPSPIALPGHCYAEYGHVTIDGANNQLVENTFEYDSDTASWVALDFDDEEVFGFQLKDGEWVAATDQGPSGPVEFLDDGGAVLQSGFGRMLVYATSNNVGNTPVIHHIYRRGGNSEFLELLNRDDLFSEGASVHHLMVKRTASAHLLFNWAPHDDPSGCEQFNGNCNVVDVIDDQGFSPAGSLQNILEQSLYGVNLSGAVHNHYEGRPVDLHLIADESTLSEDGLPTSGKATWFMPAHHTEYVDHSEYVDKEYVDGEYVDNYEQGNGDYFPPDTMIDECLPEEKLADGNPEGLPVCHHPVPSYECPEHFEEDKVEGSAVIAFDDASTAGPDHTDGSRDATDEHIEFYPEEHYPMEPCHTITTYPGEHEYKENHEYPADTTVTEEQDHLKEDTDNLALSDESDGRTVDHDGDGVADEYVDEYKDEYKEDDHRKDEFHQPEFTGGRHVLGSARWELIEIDGVTMIEIGLPLTVKHGTEAEDFASFLLIEEGGFVRRGAQLRDLDTENTVIYSEAAFDTLKAVAEDYVTK